MITKVKNTLERIKSRLGDTAEYISDLEDRITKITQSKPYCCFQSPSWVRLFAIAWTVAIKASLSLTISRSLPKFMSIASVMPSSHLILWCPFLLLFSIFSSTRVFSNELAIHIRWPKFWSFSISPSNEYSGLISLNIEWFDLLAVQGSSATPHFKGINS